VAVAAGQPQGGIACRAEPAVGSMGGAGCCEQQPLYMTAASSASYW
jgi:hypothetical protein